MEDELCNFVRKGRVAGNSATVAAGDAAGKTDNAEVLLHNRVRNPKRKNRIASAYIHSLDKVLGESDINSRGIDALTLRIDPEVKRRGFSRLKCTRSRSKI